MIDLKTKSKEQLLREKKEQELKLAKRQEAAAKRRRENHHKYMMGGVIHKHFKECFFYDENEWNRIIETVFKTPEFSMITQTIKAECERANSEGNPNGDSTPEDEQRNKKEESEISYQTDSTEDSVSESGRDTEGASSVEGKHEFSQRGHRNSSYEKRGRSYGRREDSDSSTSNQQISQSDYQNASKWAASSENDEGEEDED